MCDSVTVHCPAATLLGPTPTHQRLRADLQTADVTRIDVVPLQQARNSGQADAVDVLPVQAARPASVRYFRHRKHSPLDHTMSARADHPYRSSMNAIAFWPSPIVYLPLPTPSASSKSCWRTKLCPRHTNTHHSHTTVRATTPHWVQHPGNGPLWNVAFHAQDAHIAWALLGNRRHGA